MVPRGPAQAESGLQWFKRAFQLPDNPLQIPIVL